jgi:hypothetical protein
MNGNEPLVWVVDDGEEWCYKVMSNSFEEDMHRIITSDISGIKLEPGIYRIVKVVEDE